MKTRNRCAVWAAGAIALSLGGALAANALWVASIRTSVPEFPVSFVSFGAYPNDRPEAAQASAHGEAVTLRLPGDRLAEIVSPPEGNSKPVVWRFTTQGSAPGIAGMNYRVTVREQVGDGEPHDLSSGYARENTVLAGSTMKVFRAALGSDCSAIPETPDAAEGEQPRNVYVFDGDDVELQKPGGGTAGELTDHEWCVVVDWNYPEDGLYRNDVTVSAVSENGVINGAIARWHAIVGQPPALAMAGTYLGRAVAEGTGDNSTLLRGSGQWHADLYPDPFGEPDVVIALEPSVTSLNPEFSPSP